MIPASLIHGGLDGRPVASRGRSDWGQCDSSEFLLNAQKCFLHQEYSFAQKAFLCILSRKAFLARKAFLHENIQKTLPGQKDFSVHFSRKAFLARK